MSTRDYPPRGVAPAEDNDLAQMRSWIAARPPAAVLFELADAFKYPENPVLCPSSPEARRVWHDPVWDTYDGRLTAEAITIYFPGALRSVEGDYLGLPRGRPGDRLWCLWNAQSARWEVCQPPQTSYFGQLLHRVSGGQAAAAMLGPLNDAGQIADGVEVTGLYLAATTCLLAADVFVTARYDPDLGRFVFTPV